MKNTNSKAYNDTVKAYLLPLIAAQMEECNETAANPFKWVLDRAKSEVKHEFDRGGEMAGMEYWLSGLGLSGMDFYYTDITRLAAAWHECELTEKQQDKVCELWFRHIANKIIQYARI
jgi:hypothetical protein